MMRLRRVALVYLREHLFPDQSHLAVNSETKKELDEPYEMKSAMVVKCRWAVLADPKRRERSFLTTARQVRLLSPDEKKPLSSIYLTPP
jgi:hypothetical protein